MSNPLTRIEEDDGLETGELGVVDLHVPERADQLLQDPVGDACDVGLLAVAGDDVVVAQQEDVLQGQGAAGQSEEQVLTRVGSEEGHLGDGRRTGELVLGTRVEGSGLRI